jgi:hypothetical protein
MGTLDGLRPSFDAGTMLGYEEAGATWWLAQAEDVAGVRMLIARTTVAIRSLRFIWMREGRFDSHALSGTGS